MRVHQTISIQSTPKVVFDFLMDVTKRPDYIPALEEIKLLDPLPLRIGSRYTEVSMIAGRKYETTYQIVDMKENQSITSQTLQSVFPIRAELSILSEADKVLLSVNIDCKLVGLFALAGSIIRAIVNQQAKEILSRIKTCIEQ